MKFSRQMSESIELGIVLAIVGGFMDAYSYMCRDHVFANAQTGNILLFGVNISEGNLGQAFRYFLPVLVFALGIAISDMIRLTMKHKSILHWRQISVIFEAILLLIVSFIPEGHNLLANSLTSFACGMQVESFRKIHGNGIATTMCIGNLRSGTQNICEYFKTNDKKKREKGILYYGIIVCFAIGAIIGNSFVKVMREKAILICVVLLCVAFIMMFVDREKDIKEGLKNE